MTDVSALMKEYLSTKEQYKKAVKSSEDSVITYDTAIEWAIKFHLVLCKMIVHREVMESYFNLSLMSESKEVILTYFDLVDNRDKNIFRIKLMNAMMRRGF